MPPAGHSDAPTFDPDHPRSLRCYFSELNFLLQAAEITNDAAKKRQACRYVDLDTADLWELIPEYQPSHSFDDFKSAIVKLYPGAGDEPRHTLADLYYFVAKQQEVAITSSSDLAAYYRNIIAITSPLIARCRLSPREQSQAFLRGLQPPLAHRVHKRLELQYPDHLSDDPYPLEHVYSAARSVLEAAPMFSPPIATHPTVQTESEVLAAILVCTTNSLAQALIPNPMPPQSPPAPLLSSPSFATFIPSPKLSPITPKPPVSLPTPSFASFLTKFYSTMPKPSPLPPTVVPKPIPTPIPTSLPSSEVPEVAPHSVLAKSMSPKPSIAKFCPNVVHAAQVQVPSIPRAYHHHFKHTDRPMTTSELHAIVANMSPPLRDRIWSRPFAPGTDPPVQPVLVF